MKVKRLLSIDGGIVKIGEVCTVYSMLLWNNSLNYLLDGGPYWYSAEQFEIIDQKIPPVWYFNCKKFNNEDSNFLRTIWGYKEMVYDINHSNALQEREYDALNVFRKRKAEIDEFEEIRQNKIKNLKI